METTHKIEFGNGCRICEAWLLSGENWNPDNVNEPKAELEYHTIRIKPIIPNGTSLNEIFAINIQEAQLKEVVPQFEWSSERLELERQDFLKWLNNPEEGGKFNFKDQVSAWTEYKREYDSIPELDDDEEFTPSWMEEIENTINQAVRVANYNDFGGQL